MRESSCGEGKKRKLAECVCERARPRARGMAEGEKSGGARGRKAVEFFPKVDTFVEKVHRFFSLVERNLIFSSEDEEVCAEMPYY